ncbi:NADP+-dependent D-mannitol dehydrogenase [Ephemerocybe angulata]|uniref:NADP+-dependent D-mannitol dehydrogenase n=1 Tax=Ephemerocybe angulata TaxID=980116 RepID=A0A8H6HHN2_9AGAR|nr:NADP+-dependent D-mannitol dehydrogenase [Tulosesus angulatus]
MDAVCYKGPRELEIIRAPVPQIRDDQVLIKVTCCGICGTDYHLAEGEFLAKFPYLIPGHEIVGDVKDFQKGDRCVADNTILCDSCFHCRRGQYPPLRELRKHRRSPQTAAFAEYVAVQSKKVYKIQNLSEEEATWSSPPHAPSMALDKLSPPVGIDALILGAGPTGLILAQLLKLNGASHIVIAANKGVKTEIAQSLNAADVLRRTRPNYPKGFDVVIEATGAESVANEAINYVRRGGTLMVYGCYSKQAVVHWSPAKIFGDEIKIIGSFAQVHCFPRAVAYLESGKINVKGMVTDIFSIKDYQKHWRS